MDGVQDSPFVFSHQSRGKHLLKLGQEQQTPWCLFQGSFGLFGISPLSPEVVWIPCGSRPKKKIQRTTLGVLVVWFSTNLRFSVPILGRFCVTSSQTMLVQRAAWMFPKHHGFSSSHQRAGKKIRWYWLNSFIFAGWTSMIFWVRSPFCCWDFKYGSFNPHFGWLGHHCSCFKSSFFLNWD